ncbi:hypothetical protein POM88_019463 [Heracleum sosnowskyi]|uniref:Uncharacterized protein n=1 Tax=Heracleum sosnowskyi TaxID=360622 RepID=A0AAD8IAP2_9APIA|nr:hypothetical protein POM88_019463 [Heracleum sosnowskyi]
MCAANKVQPKCTFVTIQDYQKQHIAKKRGVHQLTDENDVNKSSVRRKLALDKDVTSGKKIRNYDKEVEDVAPKLNKYEELKRKQVAENKAVMVAMGLPKLTLDLSLGGKQKKRKNKDVPGRDDLVDGTDEYIPDATGEDSPEDVTKRKRNKKVAIGPTTRARTSAKVTTEKEKKVRESVLVAVSPVANEGATSLAPSIGEKQLERPKFAGNGTMAAYKQMLDRQRLKQARQVPEKDVDEMDLPENGNQENEEDKKLPTMGQVFIKTRKRDPEKKYKTPTEVVQLKIANVEKIISSTTDGDIADKLFCEANTSHGLSWLIGRHVKTVNQTNVGKDNYVQELTSEIRKQLADEMEEKLNKKVTEATAMAGTSGTKESS